MHTALPTCEKVVSGLNLLPGHSGVNSTLHYGHPYDSSAEKHGYGTQTRQGHSNQKRKFIQKKSNLGSAKSICKIVFYILIPWRQGWIFSLQNPWLYERSVKR